MSRLQLALNVSDLEAAVAFYSAMFGVEPHKRRPGYANFAIAEPPLKLVLIETSEATADGTAGALNHLGVEVGPPTEVVTAAAALHRGRPRRLRRERHDLLLRPAGQGVGARPRRRAVGGLHRQGREPGGARPATPAWRSSATAPAARPPARRRSPDGTALRRRHRRPRPAARDRRTAQAPGTAAARAGRRPPLDARPVPAGLDRRWRWSRVSCSAGWCRASGGALSAVEVDGVSLPIALGLLVMMYPVLAKVRYDRLDTVTGDRRMLAPASSSTGWSGRR